MGNSPSNSRGATPNSASHHHSHSAGGGPGNDSPRATKKEPKSLTSLQHAQRSAASPEASAVLAHGSTISGRTSQSRPLSVLTSSSPSTSINHTPAGSAAPSRSSESKSRPVSEFRAEPSKPVDVPLSNPDAAAAAAAHDSLYDDVGLGSGLPSSSVQDMSSYIPRPPRLPLPIEEEIHTPGSPIVAPEDVGDDIDTAPLEKDTAILPRRASGLSNATDEDDSEELRVDKTRPTVPTRVEWLGGGQKVYVTGTPFQWSRKQRLNPVPGREGVLETIIPVFPGTHHLKFLVDGNMQTSPDLPTTVDFGNNLVNYIEVNGDDAAASDVIVDPTVPKSNKEASDLPSRSGSADGLKGGATKKPQLKVIEPADIFTPALPAYLTDFDQPEESASYKLAIAAQDKLPMPPALPGFLSKPILNNTTMIKDDNSVLNMPNHTVLNHLGTCSIKNNVLAVSATTRYRNKYVTTIIYKPTD